MTRRPCSGPALRARNDHRPAVAISSTLPVYPIRVVVSRPMRSGSLAIGAMLLAGLFVAGCGGDDDDDSASDTTTAVDATSSVASSTAPEAHAVECTETTTTIATT